MTISELSRRLRHDVHILAKDIGPRHLSGRAKQVDAVAEFIEKSLTDAGYGVRSDWYTARGKECRNLEAEIEGYDEPDQIVVVGAHYDSDAESETPGADDNASGVAVLLALARAFAEYELPRTVRFVAFVNEEPPFFQKSKMGSLVYASGCHKSKEEITAMVSIECVGYFKDEPGTQWSLEELRQKRPDLFPDEPPDVIESLLTKLFNRLGLPDVGNFLLFVGKLDPLAKQGANAFAEKCSVDAYSLRLPAKIPFGPEIPLLGFSDHWSFWKRNYPAIMVTDTAMFRNPNYHRKTDTPGTLDYPRMARLTRGMEGVVRKLAGAD